MKKNEKIWLLKELMLSPAWELLQENINGLIEDRRTLLETVSPERKEVQYDWYDLLRIDIDNLRTLKSLPETIVSSLETNDMMVDRSDEL